MVPFLQSPVRAFRPTPRGQRALQRIPETHRAMPTRRCARSSNAKSRVSQHSALLRRGLDRWGRVGPATASRFQSPGRAAVLASSAVSWTQQAGVSWPPRPWWYGTFRPRKYFDRVAGALPAEPCARRLAHTSRAARTLGTHRAMPTRCCARSSNAKSCVSQHSALLRRGLDR